MDRGAYIYSCPILRFAQERKPQQPSQRATLLDESLWNIKNPRLNFQNSTSKTNLCFAVGWCMTCAALRLTLIWLFWGCLQRRRKNWTSINRLESLDQPINQPWHFRRHHRLEKTSNKNSQKWVNPNIWWKRVKTASPSSALSINFPMFSFHVPEIWTLVGSMPNLSLFKL